MGQMTPTFRDFRLIPVAPGTIMAVNQWGDDVTVQDHCAVMQGKTLWVTPGDYDRIMRERGK